MYKIPYRYAAACGLMIFAAGPRALAQDAKPLDTTSLLNQVKQLASNGQDAATADEVNKFVDDNQNTITALLKVYVNYVKQVQTMANDIPEGSGSGSTASPQSGTGNTAGVANTNAISDETAIQPSSGFQKSALQTSGVQPSSGLTTGHLKGYPSLPAVDPVTSVMQLTPEQAAYVRKVRQENLARKAELMDDSPL